MGLRTQPLGAESCLWTNSCDTGSKPQSLLPTKEWGVGVPSTGCGSSSLWTDAVFFSKQEQKVSKFTFRNNNVLYYVLLNQIGAHCPLQRTKTQSKQTSASMRVCSHTHIHTQSVGQLEEVQFQRWSERCECVWWSNFARDPDRQCSIRKRSLTKLVHAHRGKTENGNIRRRA